MHRVHVEAHGLASEERSVEAQAGSTLLVAFTLRRGAARAPEAAPPAAASTPPSSSDSDEPGERGGAGTRTTVVLSGAALTLVSLGLGTGFLIDARATSDRVGRIGRVLHGAEGPAACAGASPPPDCSTLKDAVDHERRARERADIFFTAAVVTAAGSLGAWLLIPDDSPEPLNAARITPWATPSSGGLFVEGRY
jgi:hypothetical protein